MKSRDFVVPPGKKIRLKDYDPRAHGYYQNKEEAKERLQEK